MLTDVFFVRYESKELFNSLLTREKRVLHQCFSVLEEFHPFWGEEKNSSKASSAFWEDIHKRFANELGVRWLSDPYYKVSVGLGEYQRTENRRRDAIELCRNWYSQDLAQDESVDLYIKERLSLIEIGLRTKFETLVHNEARAELFLKANPSWTNPLEGKTTQYRELCAEINTRLSAARFPLHYHNGYFQIEADELVSSKIEQPFWSLVSEALWENVDVDMKAALDLRDSGGKDPAWYAARALESAVKIVSDELGQTQGNERGAQNFVENISKKDVGFISLWEADFLKLFFSKVRNPLGHGPGSAPMTRLSAEQTDWAIESAMSWIKVLVVRLGERSGETT